MRKKISDGMAAISRPGMHWSALYTLAVLAILAWGASRGNAALFTVLALLTLLVIGWRRTRSAFLVSQALGVGQ